MAGYKMRILAKNLANAAYSTVSASPALVSSSLGEANLQLPTERGRSARTSSTAAQRIQFNFLATHDVNVVGFSRVNWTTAATLRSRIQSAAGSPSLTLADTGALTAFVASGLVTEYDDVAALDFRGYKTVIQYLSTQANAGGVICDIADAANPDGYMDQNRAWVGKYYEFRYDPPYGGLDLTLMDGSVPERAADGSVIVDAKWRARKLVIRNEFIPDADLPTVLAISRFLGKGGECLLDIFPEVDTARGIYHRGAFRLMDSVTFNPYQVGLHKNSMTFEES